MPITQERTHTTFIAEWSARYNTTFCEVKNISLQEAQGHLKFSKLEVALIPIKKMFLNVTESCISTI